MLKYLRIAVTALSLAACVVLIALWVRTYHHRTFLWQIEQWKTVVVATDGRIAVFSLKTRPERPFAKMNRWGFRINPICMPCWFPVVLSAVLTALPWTKWRFSLRTLLIATTLVAVLLGAIVAAT